MIKDRNATDERSNRRSICNSRNSWKNLYDVKNKANFIATQYKGFWFLNVDITDDGTKLIGTFYANEDGSVKDTFTITKLNSPTLIIVKDPFSRTFSKFRLNLNYYTSCQLLKY
jgi:hypothetical protein